MREAGQTHLLILLKCRLEMLGEWLERPSGLPPTSCSVLVVPPGWAPGVSGRPADCAAMPDSVSPSVVSVSSGTETDDVLRWWLRGAGEVAEREPADTGGVTGASGAVLLPCAWGHVSQPSRVFTRKDCS